MREIADARGAVLRFVRSDDEDFLGFGECYFSEILPGAVKAWKRHRVQTQNFVVPIGRVRLVVFDDREASPTRGGLDVIVLGRPDAYERVRVPPGVWYGFATLGNQAAVVANCPDVPHDPAEADSRAWNDPSIPFAWVNR